MSININEPEELEYADFINVEEVEKLIGCKLPDVLPITFSATFYEYTSARINCSNDDACPEEGGYLEDACFMFKKVDITDFIHLKTKDIFESRWYDRYNERNSL